MHLLRDLEDLKRDLLAIGAMVEEALTKAIRALMNRRLELALAVQNEDDAINDAEVRLEEDCLKVLALNQPVAGDLRFIVTVLKVNNDLERMGDLAVNIAERAAFLCAHDAIDVPLDFERMVDCVQTMVRDSLDALVNQDPALARSVCAADDTVDDINREMYERLAGLMREEPDTIPRAIHTLSASRHLERIADLATNIAEDVIFLVDGEVVRHQLEDYLDGGAAG